MLIYIIEVNIIKIISRIGLADNLDFTNQQSADVRRFQRKHAVSPQLLTVVSGLRHHVNMNILLIGVKRCGKTRVNSTFLHRPVVIRFSLVFLSVYVPWTIIFNTWKIRLWLKEPDDNIITDTADDRPYGDVAEAEGEGLNWPWVTKVLILIVSTPGGRA